MILKLFAAAATVLALTAQQSAAQFTVALPNRAVSVEYSEGATIFKGAPVYGEPGQPSLPGYKVTFLLPDGIDPNDISVTIENPIEEVVRGTFYVKPALPPTIRGEMIWPTNKNIFNGMDMDIYGRNAFFPADYNGAVTFGKMKQYQLIDVVINPFRYNPVTRQLKKITGGTLTVFYPQGTSAVKKSTLSAMSATEKVDGKTEKFLRKKVINSDVIDSYEVQTVSISAKSATTLAATQAVTAGEGYAIITTNAIVSASTKLQNLISQKTALGYNVILATENTWGGGTGNAATEHIRQWLQQNISTQNLSYVLLIGNSDPVTGDVPMRMCRPRVNGSTYEAPTDFYYAELSGNWDLNGDGFFGEDGVDFGPSGGADIYAEVAVGRIPYYGSITDLDKIFAKSIAYANETSRGWRKSVLLPMVPSDATTPGFYLGEEIKNNYLSPNNWKSFRIFDLFSSFTQQYIPEVFALTPTVDRAPCNTEHVEDAWKKNPFGLVIWWTHGSDMSAEGIISTSQAPNLNVNYPSMTFQVSCENSFPEVSTNLSYSLLLNGAVSAIGATRVSWYFVGQNSEYLNTGSNSGMGYTYGLYTTRDGMSTGDALNAVKSDVSGTLVWMNHLVFNIYGCPDLTLDVDKSAPTECRTYSSSPTRTQITWVDNSTTETGYRIERATGSGSFAEIATVGADVNVYTNNGLAANAKYRYRVRAYSASTTSDYSNIDSTSTFTNVALGKTVTASSQQTGNGVANAIDNNATSTRWAASSATMPQWYKVDLGANLDLSGCEIVFERTGTTGDCNDFIVSTSSDNVNWTEQVNKNTNTNTAQTQAYTFQATTRYVRITISDAPGTYYASIYEFRVFGQTVPTNPIWKPSVNLPDVEQLQLSWTPSTGATSYTVYQAQAGQPRFVIASGLTTTSFTTTGLVGGKQYIFSVVAYNAAGHSTTMEGAVELSLTAPMVAPIAPLDLSISQINYLTAYSLSWQNSANSFEIERRVMNTSTWTVIGTTPSGVTKYLDVSVNTSTTYEYRVRAHNAAGYSDYSVIVNTLIAPPPPIITSTTYDAVASTVSLTWNLYNSSHTGYRLEKTINFGTYELVATFDPSVTSYTITGLADNSVYTYRLCTFNNYGNSEYVYTSSVATTPYAPSNLTATLYGSEYVNLEWNDNSNSEEGFLIEQAIGNGEFLQIGVHTYMFPIYTVSSLSPSTTYRFRIRAYNTDAKSGYSNIVTITTPASIPAAPINLSATAVSSSQINLSWTDNANNEDGFYIESATASAGPFTQIASVGANVTTYSNATGLSASTAYWYQVRAYNAGGNSAYTNTATATTLATIPNAPGTLTATAASSSQINLSWTDNATNENGFYIERATAAAGPFTQIASLGANVTTYSSTGLTASTSYWYKVRAYNAAGNSAYSNTATATTPSAIPAVPSNLVATINLRSQITLTWSDNATNESGFYIERATASAGPFTQIASVGANVLTYANTSLTANTAYWYKVRAYNANGNSAYTATVTATTHTNLSTSGTASAQSQQTGNLATNAKDNSTTTRWAASSGTMPQWWKIDLGSSKTISEVEVMFERVGTTGDCNDFKVETSTDNATWTSRVDKTTNTNTAQTQGYTFSATARYVRITFSDAPGTYYASMYEFRVFGK